MYAAVGESTSPENGEIDPNNSMWNSELLDMYTYKIPLM